MRVLKKMESIYGGDCGKIFSLLLLPRARIMWAVVLKVYQKALSYPETNSSWHILKIHRSFFFLKKKREKSLFF